MAVDIGARISLDGEASYNKQIAQVIKQQKELKAVMQGTQAAFSADASNKEKSAAKTRVLTAQLDSANAKLKLQTDQLKRLEEAGQGSSAAADNLRVSIARTEAEVAKLQSELRKNSPLAAIGKDMQEAGDKIQSAGRGLSSFGSTMIRSVTAPIVAAGAAAVKLAADFETAMAKLNSIADTTAVPLEKLEKQIMDLSNTTGIAASELAEQAYQAISAGQNTADAVKFVETSTRLARAGFTETGSALDVLTTILNAYGKSSSEATAISDKLILTQNLGKITVGQLAESMGNAIPTAAAYSVDIDNISSAYVTMTKQGVNSANATTQINALMNDLGKSGTKAAKVLKTRTGQSFKELMQSGYSLTDVLEILQDEAEDNGVALNDMFGNVRAGRGAMALMNDAGVTFTNTLGEMAKAAGVTDEAFEKVTNTSAFRFEQTLNRVKNTGIEAGQRLLIAFGPTLEKIANAIARAADGFSRLSDTQKDAILKTALFAAAIGPASSALGGLTTGIGKTVSGLGKLLEQWGLAEQIPMGPMVGLAGAAVALGVGYTAAALAAYDANNELISTATEAKGAADATESLITQTKESAAAYDESTAAIDSNRSKAEALIGRLEEFEKVSHLSAEAQEAQREAVDELNRLYPDLNLQIDENTGKLSQNTTEIRNNIKEFANKAKAEAAYDRAVEIQKQLLEIEKQRTENAGKIKAAQDAKTQAQAKYNAALNEGYKTGEAAYNVDMLTERQVVKTTAAVDELTAADWELAQQKNSLTRELETLGGAYDLATTSTDENTAATQQEILTSEAAAEAAAQEAAAQEAAAAAIADAADLKVGAFEKVTAAQTVSAQELIAGLQSQIDAYTNYRSNLATLNQFIQEDSTRDWSALANIFAEGGIAMAGELQGVVDAINSGDTDILDSLATLPGGVSEANAEVQTEIRKTSDIVATGLADIPPKITTHNTQIMTAAKAAAQGIGSGWRQGSGAAGPRMYTDTGTAMGRAKQAITAKTPEIKKAAQNAADAGAKGFADEARAKGPALNAAGQELAQAAANGVNAGSGSLAAAGSGSGQAVANAMRNKRAEAEAAGEYISLGLAKGINKQAQAVNAAATNVASIAIRQMRNVPQLGSPSRVTTQFGEWISQGLAIGMLQKIGQVSRAAGKVANSAIAGIGNAYTDLPDQSGLDPDAMYAAVRDGASQATRAVYLNGRDLTRGLRELGVSFSNG